MTEATWRDEWPTFRLALVDETARCLADHLPAESGGHRLRWEALTRGQQVELTEHVAAIFIAQDQAMNILIERGLALES